MIGESEKSHTILYVTTNNFLFLTTRCLLEGTTPIAEPAALESRNDEQTATDRNQVLEQSNVEILLAQGLYEPSANLIAPKTPDDPTDHSEPGTNNSRPSTAKRNACTR